MQHPDMTGAFVFLAAVLVVVGFVVWGYQYTECSARGGVLVQGTLIYECVARPSP